jgi:hypothetical protein
MRLFLAELFQIAVCWRGDQLRKDKHESDPKKYSCRWVIQLMLISNIDHYEQD